MKFTITSFTGKYFFMALALFLSFICLSPPAAVSAEERSVIVGFHHKPGPSEQTLIHASGGSIHRTFRMIPAITTRVPEHALAGLCRNPHVEYVEEDSTVSIIDPYYLTALSTDLPDGSGFEYENSWGVQHIGCEAIHNLYTKGSGIKIAVIDTGIDYTHEDLSGNYCGGYDIIFNDDDPFDDSWNSHGTHMAGIIAAEANGIGVVGVAPEASLYAVKVMDGAGFGTLSGIIAGIEWAVDNNMDIANISIAGPDSQALKDACDAACDAGLLLVAAAGNTYGGNVTYPAAYDSVIAVTATDQEDQPADSAPLGPELELAAPGVNILSAAKNDGYAELSGTSQAASHVTGTAALMMSAGMVNNHDIRQRLQATAIDLGDDGPDNQYGYGLLDAATAAIPDVVIDLVTLAEGTGNIIGSGFGDYMDTETGAFVTTTQTIGKGRRATTVMTTEPCAIISWTDTQIVVECDATSGTIEVYSVYGTAFFDVACNDRPVKRPKKRKK
ncbi:MAG: S8 family peptidase [Thermodesulfobacteriota bacterium]|nr:S8 family peptidase [Thermodesulfobacteriota bacterium]